MPRISLVPCPHYQPQGEYQIDMVVRQRLLAILTFKLSMGIQVFSNVQMPRTGYFHNGVPIPVPPQDVLQLADSHTR